MVMVWSLVGKRREGLIFHFGIWGEGAAWRADLDWISDERREYDRDQHSLLRVISPPHLASVDGSLRNNLHISRTLVGRQDGGASRLMSF